MRSKPKLHRYSVNSGVDPASRISSGVLLPDCRRSIYERKLAALGVIAEPGMPVPRFTALEDVVPRNTALGQATRCLTSH